MGTTLKDKQINVKVNSKIYEDAKEVFRSLGMDTTGVFNQLIRYVAIKQELPFKTEEEEKREQLIDELSFQFDSLLLVKSEFGGSDDKGEEVIKKGNV